MTTYETDPERLRRMRGDAALFWEALGPAAISPLLPGGDGVCRICHPWAEQLAGWHEAEEAAEQHGTESAPAGDVSVWLDLEERLTEHRAVLHRPMAFLPEEEDLRRRFVAPEPDVRDGRVVYQEPRERGGTTVTSKAYFLLNRHRPGRITTAMMTDSERGAVLRLYDERGRGLHLLGCTAGNGGEGPRGTLFVLRLAGFPEGVEAVPGRSGRERTPLERVVLTLRTFVLRRDGDRLLLPCGRAPRD